MSAKTNGFAQGTVLKVAYSMLGLTSAVVLARIGLNIIKPRRLTASDYFVFIAFATYLTMCALYIAVSPYMQKVYAVMNGEMQPYPGLPHDGVLMAKVIFTAFCMFWMVLWCIKLSLLLLYRRLLHGISRRYTVVWWCIAGICLVVSCHHSASFGSKTDIEIDVRRQLLLLFSIMRHYTWILDGKMCKSLSHLMYSGLPINAVAL
jgi:magnesium-transporting ATPase (P-type)